MWTRKIPKNSHSYTVGKKKTSQGVDDLTQVIKLKPQGERMAYTPPRTPIATIYVDADIIDVWTDGQLRRVTQHLEDAGRQYELVVF